MPPVRTAKKSSSLKRNEPTGMMKDWLARGAAKEELKSRLESQSNSLPVQTYPAPAASSSANTLNTVTSPEVEFISARPLPASDPVPAPASPKKPVNAFSTLKAARSIPKGVESAYFEGNWTWDASYQDQLGHSTKKVCFDTGFILTDQHIDHLISLGPGFCRRLTNFEFNFGNVNYDAHNRNEVTDQAAVQLACKCPNLRFVKLQGVHYSNISDATLMAFLSHCPRLISIEITGEQAFGIAGAAEFDALREHPGWAPKLKILRVPRVEGTIKQEQQGMKAMRALTRERGKLSVAFVTVRQLKKWGDWELEVYEETFRQGKSQGYGGW